jgi:hypothetical protein
MPSVWTMRNWSRGGVGRSIYQGSGLLQGRSLKLCQSLLIIVADKQGTAWWRRGNEIGLVQEGRCCYQDL